MDVVVAVSSNGTKLDAPPHLPGRCSVRLNTRHSCSQTGVSLCVREGGVGVPDRLSPGCSGKPEPEKAETEGLRVYKLQNEGGQ